MLQMKSLKTSVLLLATLATTAAFAKPSSQKIAATLNSPGAYELMAEEVELWKRNLETKHLTARAQVALSGTGVLRGQPSPAQRFNRGKLIHCEPRMIGSGQFAAMRNSCDTAHPVYLPLSADGKDQPTSVPAGYYVLGFENSMYPGFLQVTAGQQTAVQLIPVGVPAGGKVKIYRDLNSLTEEFKLYFATYVLGESLFKLSEYSFGDLYLKSFGTRDGMVPLDYKTCEKNTPELTTKGERICRAWNMGTFMSVTEMFDFSNDGSFTQYELGSQGKPYPYKLGRLLVAKSTDSTVATFVNVLPGQYTVELTNPKGLVSRGTTGAIGIPNQNQNLSATLTKNLGWLPPTAKLKMIGGDVSIAPPPAINPLADPNAPPASVLASSDDGDRGGYIDPNQTCGSSKLWRTELRSYCTSDKTPGCARASAQVCEPMAPIEDVP